MMTENTVPAQRRPLGRSGLEVSAIGFGCWAIGGPHSRNGDPIGWGEVDDEESVAAIHAALDEGVTFFDTADVYGCGHSERVLARALRGRRDGVVVATKFGFTYDEERRESPGTDDSPAYVRTACEASLRRLETDVIDLLQFHLGGCDPAAAQDVLGVLEDLVDEGKIRSFGWSTDDPERAAMFAASPHCAAIQQAFNVLGGNAETLAICEAAGLASIVRGPLGMGVLSGKMSGDTRFAADDVRHGWDFRGSQADTLAAVDRVREVLTSDGRTLAQGALCWLLARSPAFVPIPGCRTVAQARENAGALRHGPLSADEMAAVESALGR
ncbi:Predicted oxidoreductase [Actinopolymorpha cephalotaxi]|uniref:Predicted oxidoreductase n=1 Tax=Actinopolymorpha cephalotaxi TaxID=504797 RepID=A0A1I2PFZ2_9ACTN|nr:aldo/keto reductase [Actinopolymorpha cephalotaxi]NYH83711.1 aryl-alcohol dehydrogenase-like predicted oxidoreductase [Actinopolymorpha cephalotaxi]SFG12351.1 Predicted oxidoreductase [Actinopolymorpha cephalotaxi]